MRWVAPWPNRPMATVQLELSDRRRWDTRHPLAQAIFEYIEAIYNAERRHSSLQYPSPIDYEQRRGRIEAAP